MSQSRTLGAMFVGDFFTEAGVSVMTSSEKVFQLPQAGQRPDHFADSYPHSEQINTVFCFAKKLNPFFFFFSITYFCFFFKKCFVFG